RDARVLRGMRYTHDLAAAWPATGGLPMSHHALQSCLSQRLNQRTSSRATEDLSHRPKADIAPHSITSLARCCKSRGTLRPSAPAALRLITNSNLVGACTGRLPGFSPLKMRSA